jgi:hypothetical protein
VKKVFKRRAKTFEDHGIIFAFRSKPMEGGDAMAAREALVDICFVLELGVVRIQGLDLDGYFLPRHDVDSKVNSS